MFDSGFPGLRSVVIDEDVSFSLVSSAAELELLYMHNLAEFPLICIAVFLVGVHYLDWVHACTLGVTPCRGWYVPQSHDSRDRGRSLVKGPRSSNVSGSGSAPGGGLVGTGGRGVHVFGAGPKIWSWCEIMNSTSRAW